MSRHIGHAMTIVAVGIGVLLSGTPARAQSGPLFSPSARPASRPAATERTVVRSRDVDVRVDQLTGAAARAAGATLELNLFSDVTFTATLSRIDTTARGFSWVGRIAGDPFSTVTMTIEGTTVFGSVLTTSGTYLVRPSANGVSSIVEIDQSQFPPESEPLVPPATRPTEPAVPASPLPAPDAPPQADDASTIDVLVLFTPSAVSAAGGATAMNTLISNAISVTNTAYGNSGVVQRLRLAAAIQVSYTESGDNGVDLSNVTAGVGALSGVPALRDAYRADLVTMLTNTASSPYCGIAWMMTSISTGFAPNGYSVVEQACAVGNLTFPHELGHNMGLRHDWYVDAGVTPATYAHGYVNSTGRWRTIMAYNDRCAVQGFNCSRVAYWSNPGVTYLGAAMGVAGGTSASCLTGSLTGNCDADDHRLLNESALSVANFRQNVLPTFKLTVDFGSVGLWNYGESGGVGVWMQTNSVSPTVLARADIDGGGVTDLIVVFPGSGIWTYMNSTSWSRLHPLDASDIKAGDVDGNGRADLVISFPGAGVWVRLDSGSWSQIHSLNPTAIAIGNIDTSTGPEDIVLNFPTYGVWAYVNRTSWVNLHGLQSQTLAVGDLDGNGVGDVVTQFAGYGEYVLFNSTTWSPLHSLAASGIAIGNVDNDAGHKNDVIVNFPGAGVWVYRNNSTWQQVHPLNATVMTVSDLDGNGMDDVVLSFPGYGIYVWKNSSTWSALHSRVPELMSGR